MFFPFSKQSKVKTHKSSFSNNGNFTHNDFKISLLSFHPIMKIGSSNRNNSTNGQAPNPISHTVETPEKIEEEEESFSISQKIDFKTLILCTFSCLFGGAITLCALNFIKKRKNH